MTDLKRAHLGNPRWIQDPELPDDEEEKLYFTMINMDMSNLTEVRRLTKLEMEGCIDQAGLDEFVKACPKRSCHDLTYFPTGF